MLPPFTVYLHPTLSIIAEMLNTVKGLNKIIYRAVTGVSLRGFILSDSWFNCGIVNSALTASYIYNDHGPNAFRAYFLFPLSMARYA